MGWGGEWVVQFFHTVNIYKLDPFGFYHFAWNVLLIFVFMKMSNIIFFYLYTHEC